MKHHGEQRQEPLTFWEIVASTLAAALGVQSSKNRQRDFTRGNPVHFIVAGLVFVVLFVVSLMTLVHLLIAYT